MVAFTLLWCQFTCLAQLHITLWSTSYLQFVGILPTGCLSIMWRQILLKLLALCSTRLDTIISCRTHYQTISVHFFHIALHLPCHLSAWDIYVSWSGAHQLKLTVAYELHCWTYWGSFRHVQVAKTMRCFRHGFRHLNSYMSSQCVQGCQCVFPISVSSPALLSSMDYLHKPPQPLRLPLVIAVGKLWWSLKSQHCTINNREYHSTGDAWPIQTQQ